MASAVGDLIVHLGAQTKGFDRGMNQARGRLGSFGMAVNNMTARLKSMAIGFAGIAGAGALGMFVKSQFASIDAVAKLGNRLNATTEFLSSMAFASEQSGASADIFNNALTTMVRRIGLASEGLGEGKRTLEDLGISAQTLASLRADEQFKIIAERISKIPGAAGQAAAAFGLFGRQGQQLLPLLKGGAAGLAEFVRQAKKLGISFSEIDAAEIIAANDAVNAMKKSAGGLLRKLVIGLGPAIKDLANSLTKLFVAGQSAFGGILGRVGRLLPTFIKLGVAFVAAKTAVFALNIVIRAFTLAQKAAAGASIFLQAVAGPAGWANIAVGIAAATAAIVVMNKTLDSTVAGVSKVAAQTPAATSALAEIGAQAPAIERTTGAVQGLAAAMTRAGGSLPQRTLAQGLAGFQTALANAEKGMNTFGDVRSASLGAAIRDFDRLGKTVSGPFGRWAERISGLLRGYAHNSKLYGNTLETTLTKLRGELATTVTAMGALSDLRSPIERLQELQQHLNTLRRVGLISVEERARLAARALEEFDQAIGGPAAKIADLRLELERLKTGITADAQALRELAATPGVSPEQIRTIEELQRKIASAQKTAKMKEFGAALTKQFLPPAEKALAEAMRIQEAFAAGAITEETRQRALQAQITGLQPEAITGAMAQTRPQPVGAAERGSREAFSAIQAAIRGGAEKDLKKNTATTARNTREMIALLREILEASEGGEPPLDIPT